MKTKFYQQIPVGRELPKESGNYHTEHGILHFDLKLKDWSGENESYEVDYFLKEIPFMEIMIGFAKFLSDYNDAALGGMVWLKFDYELMDKEISELKAEVERLKTTQKTM